MNIKQWLGDRLEVQVAMEKNTPDMLKLHYPLMYSVHPVLRSFDPTIKSSVKTGDSYFSFVTAGKIVKFSYKTDTYSNGHLFGDMKFFKRKISDEQACQIMNCTLPYLALITNTGWNMETKYCIELKRRNKTITSGSDLVSRINHNKIDAYLHRHTACGMGMDRTGIINVTELKQQLPSANPSRYT